ncbi:MAG: TonB-dependent receptor [Halioglobus sp.]|nr:TonB-dependent receptor [Halioglobus sp.]
MTSPTARTTIVAALALASSVNAPGALAQGKEPGLTLEEVVVTARRRTENLQDVPIAVTAFTGDALTLRGSSDISDLAQVVPSVTLEPSRATSSTLTAFIRGVGQQDPLAGYEQGVGLYLDDVYLARPQGSLLDIYDVERIEVLRGPQGTLYGRNTVGGAIKYVTRRLREEPEARIRASYGSYDQIDLVGSASTPLSSTFRVGGTVASLTRDGYGENKTTGDDQYDKDIFAYRLSAEFLPSENWLVRLAYDNTQDDTNAVAGYRPFPGAVSGEPVLGDLRDSLGGAAQAPSTAGINGRNELETEGTMLSIEWHASDSVTLRSITAYREDYTESVIDFDSLKVIDFDAPVIYKNDQTSQEFQLHYSADQWVVVAGAYYLDASAANDFDVVLGQLGPVTAYTGGSVDTEAWSVFADVTYNLSERLALSLGGRYTDDERSVDVFRGTYLGVGSPFFGNDAALLLAVTSDYRASKSWTDFSPRVNLSYLLRDDTTLYGGYSQGWKAGMFDPRGANLLTPAVEEGVDPETLDSYEIGLKTVWWDGRALTNIAVFYSEYDDMQIPGSVGIDSDGDGVNDDFIGTLTNAGQATIAGIEVEGNYLLTEKFSAQLALSLLDTEIDEWLVDDVDVSSQRQIQNTPEEMAYLGLTYRTGFLAGTLTLNGNWSYRGKTYQFEVAAPLLDQDSYDLFNASVVWESGDEHWLLGVHGKNLTDEDVKTSGYCFGFEGCPSVLGLENNTSIFYAAPLTLTGTLEYRF